MKYKIITAILPAILLDLKFFILHFSLFIEFCEAKFFWASPRFAGSGYPLHQPRKRGWFRYYPSRKDASPKLKMQH